MRILITGTSSGIGKGIAEKFLKEGHHVTGFDRKEASLQNPHYTHICLDIREKAHYPALEPFDIVINNAGVQNEEDIDVNLKGTIAITGNLRHPLFHPQCSHESAPPVATTALSFRSMSPAKAAFFPIQKMLLSALPTTGQPATA